MANQYASGKVPTLTRKLNAADLTAYLDSDVGVTSGRLYLSNNLQEEWINFTGVAASGSEFAYSGLTRGLSQTADPITGSTGSTWLAGQQCALVAMHDQMFNKNRPEPIVYATTAARDAALGADGAAVAPWINVYVTATGLHYNYNLSTAQWEAIETGTVTPNASTTVAGKVEIAVISEIENGTNTGGTGAYLSVLPSDMAYFSQSGFFNYAYSSSVSDTYTANLQPALQLYVIGMKVRIKFATANTGACTLNLNGLGAKSIKTEFGNDPLDNDITAGCTRDLYYDGTNFVLNYAPASNADATHTILKDAFGAPSTSYTSGNNYQAAVAGIVTATYSGGNTSSTATITGYTDSSATPSTVVAKDAGVGDVTSGDFGSCSITFAVKKDNYFKIVTSFTNSGGTLVVNFVPFQ